MAPQLGPAVIFRGGIWNPRGALAPRVGSASPRSCLSRPGRGLQLNFRSTGNSVTHISQNTSQEAITTLKLSEGPSRQKWFCAFHFKISFGKSPGVCDQLKLSDDNLPGGGRIFCILCIMAIPNTLHSIRDISATTSERYYTFPGPTLTITITITASISFPNF